LNISNYRLVPLKKEKENYNLPLTNKDFCKFEDPIEKTFSYYNGENWDISEDELI
jgi:hypothetical protein